MPRSRGFLFVDSGPSSTNIRNRELQKSDALSHAARASHPKNRKGHPVDSDEPEPAENIYAPERPPIEQYGPEPLRTGDAYLDEEDNLPKHRRSGHKKSYDVHRWRIIQKQPGPRKIPAKKAEPRSSTNSNKNLGMTLPMHKGNSDPFDSTSVPVTALNFAMIKDDRTSLVDIVWPAEIAMRRNHSSLVGEMWKVMPSVVDAPAVAHAILSHSHFSRAVRYQVSGRRDQTATALAEKHKAAAIGGLRDLLDEYSRTARPELLVQVRGASTQLAACGVISGDVASSQLHYAGVKMAVDLLGGLKKMRRMQSEALVFSMVASAWFSRQRPVFDSEEWDPGAWADYTSTMPEPVDSAVPSHLGIYGDLKPSAIRPAMGAIIDDFRELVHVEEIKHALASSQSAVATQVFRWFSLRKLALRARNLDVWCDLKDEIEALAPDMGHAPHTDPSNVSSAAFNTIVCLAVRSFDRAIFEEYYYVNQPSFRFSAMFFAEAAANLRRLDPPFPYEVDDPQMDEDSQRRKVLEDQRRFDILWIYSVGAYIEDSNVKPAAKAARGTSTESMVSSPIARGEEQQGTRGGSNGPFSARFSKLAKVLGLESFEDVTGLLTQRYLYCARLQDGNLRRLMGK